MSSALLEIIYHSKNAIGAFAWSLLHFPSAALAEEINGIVEI